MLKIRQIFLKTAPLRLKGTVTAVSLLLAISKESPLAGNYDRNIFTISKQCKVHYSKYHINLTLSLSYEANVIQSWSNFYINNRIYELYYYNSTGCCTNAHLHQQEYESTNELFHMSYPPVLSSSCHKKSVCHRQQKSVREKNLPSQEQVSVTKKFCHRNKFQSQKSFFKKTSFCNSNKSCPHAWPLQLKVLQNLFLLFLAQNCIVILLSFQNKMRGQHLPT